MNTLLIIGLLLLCGYSAGWLCDRIGLPRILGYILTGVLASPHSFGWVAADFLTSSSSLMAVCLVFIAFEVGESLQWKRLRTHGPEILQITVWASLLPLILVPLGLFLLVAVFPGLLPVQGMELIAFALLLGALASPTEPAATLAVIHQYRARGPVTDTILGVVALDDALGVILFSLVTGLAIGWVSTEGLSLTTFLMEAGWHLGGAIPLGFLLGRAIDPLSRVFQGNGEGRWVVIIFAVLILAGGVADLLRVDPILTGMVMGMTVVNRSVQRGIIFRIVDRYTEDLIFLFFFLLSGLHLDLTSFATVGWGVLVFILLRGLGKVLGVALGGHIAHAKPAIRRHTAGGLLPQAGVVIGLALSVYDQPELAPIADPLLVTVMAATVIHELLGPMLTRRALSRAGEIPAPTRTPHTKPPGSS